MLDGKNSTFFVYGDVGTGKSFTLFGQGVNRGIVPLFVDGLFERVSLPNPEILYSVALSMVEIINDTTRCLLDTTSKKSKRIALLQCRSREDLEDMVSEGLCNRTRNVVSQDSIGVSPFKPAHVVVTVTLMMTKITNGMVDAYSTMTTKAHFVELVSRHDGKKVRPSDRVAVTHNNNSLSALVRVLTAMSTPAKQKVIVPFRESALTQVLNDSWESSFPPFIYFLATISTVDFASTSATLRFARSIRKTQHSAAAPVLSTSLASTSPVPATPLQQNAPSVSPGNTKSVQLSASKSASLPLQFSPAMQEAAPAPAASLYPQPQPLSQSQIQALVKERNEQALVHQEQSYAWASERNNMLAELSSLQEQLYAQSDQLQQSEASRQSLQYSLHELQAVHQQAMITLESAMAPSPPRLTLLSPNPHLADCVQVILSKPSTVLGRNEGFLDADSVSMEHCRLDVSGHTVIFTPLDIYPTFVNGNPAQGPVALRNGDRVVIGSKFAFRFDDPEAGEHGSSQSLLAAIIPLFNPLLFLFLYIYIYIYIYINFICKLFIIIFSLFPPYAIEQVHILPFLLHLPPLSF
jgi:hypothetical protein